MKWTYAVTTMKTFQSEATYEEEKEQIQRKLMKEQNSLLEKYRSREVRFRLYNELWYTHVLLYILIMEKYSSRWVLAWESGCIMNFDIQWTLTYPDTFVLKLTVRINESFSQYLILIGSKTFVRISGVWIIKWGFTVLMYYSLIFILEKYKDTITCIEIRYFQPDFAGGPYESPRTLVAKEYFCLLRLIWNTAVGFGRSTL